jgi:hypothetical protein
MSNQDSQPILSYSLTAFLGDLGSLPFTLLGLLMVQGYVAGPGLQSTSVLGLYAPYVFIAYSAVILSFLCGALWAEARVSEPGLLANATVALSNLLALSAWASLLLNYVAPIMTIFAVTLLLAGFLSLLWAERLLGSQAGEPDRVYWSMRLRITVVVAVWHVVVVYMMIQELNL